MNRISFTGLVTVLLVGAFLYVYMGFYNVAATSPHMSFIENLLHEIKENSVKRHAKGLIKPAVSKEDIFRSGFKHYDYMCVECHSAPGIEDSEIKKGLYPTPPRFPEDIEEMTIEEIFWVTKNGLKMSGMPAFGPTHKDKDIWSIAFFVKELEGISSEQYKELKERLSQKEKDTNKNEKNDKHPHKHGHNH